MTQLYHVNDESFETWLKDSPHTAAEVAEAIAVMRAKQSLLWMRGSEDSYRRDRYEVDAALTARIAKCEALLLWIGA